MNRILLSVLMLLTLALLFNRANPPVHAQEPPANLSEQVEGNNAFAIDLYQQIVSTDEGNIFFSPYSVSSALAMTYAGARATTEQQMAEALHFVLPQAELHAAFNTITTSLTQRAEEPLFDGDEGQRLQINIANALWGQEGFAFNPDFIQTLESSYGAGLRQLDFMSAPEDAREEINAWVEEQTEERIQNIVPEGAITPETRLVLANAIYFFAQWMEQFNEANTEDAPFFLLDGESVTVPMMFQEESHLYADRENYQTVALSYYGGDTSMVIVLPDEGQFEAVETALTAEAFTGIIQTPSYAEMRLYMPRFEFEFALELSDVLEALGMVDAFSGDADFSGMAEEALYISRVLHKAFVAVDENGTEAAAATVVIMEAMAAPPPDQPLEVRLDRPFIFAIVDNVTGSILFVGRVMNPA